MKRHERNSKYEPLVDGVELLEANPQYAHIRKPDGTETTVSLKHLAPKGNDSNANQPQVNVPSDVISQSEVCDTQSLELVIHLLLSSLYSNPVLLNCFDGLELNELNVCVL